MSRHYRSPLLVTGCDGCGRRRACATVLGCAPVVPWWLCRQCIERVLRAGKSALAEFAAQARKGRNG